MKVFGAVFLALLLPVFFESCSDGLRDPVRADSPDGILDLRGAGWKEPLLPQGWLWDADVFWTPGTGGRPAGLPRAARLGPPDLGGALAASMNARHGGLVQATAHLVVLVHPTENYGLQIGALPGAYEVWVNDVLVAKSGVVSVDRAVYRADGAGTVLSVQPREGRLDIVAAFATDDPLVRHSEMNRYWVLGPADELLNVEQAERSGRSLQAMFLLLGSLIFFGIAMMDLNRRTILPFVGFLVFCLLKLIFNVEQAEPFLGPFFQGFSPSFYLYVNHGLNLLPFPFFVLFMARQFPEDVSFFSFLVIVAATVAATLWELLPFVSLSLGAQEFYALVMRSQWTFVLNLYVVLVVLFIFERIYHVFTHKRPLSSAILFGGVAMGLIVLMPIPLSYFLPVKYTFFLGWGVFLFLFVLGYALIRQLVRDAENQIQELSERLSHRDILGRFLPLSWAHRFGRDAVESLRPGDRRSSEASFVQIRAGTPDLWLPLVGEVAASRKAMLVDWKEGTGLWVLDSWPEAALAFALEAQIKMSGLPGLPGRIVVSKAEVEFRVIDVGPSWHLTIDGVPTLRLNELDDLAHRYGTPLLLDARLQDGLVIGGWRRHRRLTVSGGEIELYEAEEPSLAEIKDRTLDTFERALAEAKAGRLDQAIQVLVGVVRQNPFDRAALALLSEWGAKIL